MKILIFSDSHKDTREMEAVTTRLSADVSFVLHLGDCYEDAQLMAQKFSNLNFHWVPGNCDFIAGMPQDKIVSIGGKKIWMTHGHCHSVKSNYQRLVYAAQEKEVDLCLFGHTHIPAVFYESGVAFLNPGSISRPKETGRLSYGIVDIDDGNLRASVVTKYGDLYRLLLAP